MNRSSFRAGMYLLENLTSGMYNDPLSIYREYIQNSVDSFDMSDRKRNRDYFVDIELDPFSRSIKIYDNGLGIPSNKAEETLSSIGDSDKRGLKLRGFRGIGRLGGIAFCDRAIFRTKAEGETSESIQEWDCRKLKNILDLSHKSLTFKQIFQNITKFYRRNNLSKSGSYFEVTLHDVSSFKNHVFDIERVRNYLSQVAPVPFELNVFPFGRIIDDYLGEKLHRYGQYRISINGEGLHKPYGSLVRTTKNKGGGLDHIEDVELFCINIGKEKPIAYGWYGKRKELLGSISKGESCSGIRVRTGNIMIGNSHLLDKCFREDRFNSYVIGEIHVDSDELIPNSRRDDFIDNNEKTLFYNEVEKVVGLPISKEIRLKSRINNTIGDKKIAIIPSGKPHIMDDIANEILILCGKCHKSHKILSKLKISN